MSKRTGVLIGIFVVITLFGGIVFSGALSEKAPQSIQAAIPFKKKPSNIVLLIIDTLRADKLGAYNFPNSVSPEIDAIAEKGTVFEKAIAQSAWTRSSYGSFLTSLYPRTVGIYKEQWDSLREDFTTLPELLQAGGYRTVGVTANPNINAVFKFDQGFDEYFDSQVVYDWMSPDEGQEKLGGGARLPRAGDIFGQALKEAENSSKSPLYLQLNIMETHGWRKLRSDSLDPDLKGYSKAVGRYLQTLRRASREVGVFIKALEELPGWDDALIIIASDHGEGLDDHPDVKSAHAHGNVVYESQVAVPLIFYHTGGKVPKGYRVKEMVTLLDLMPTIAEFAGVSIPHRIEGRSLKPLLSGADPSDFEFSPVAFAEANWGEADKIAAFSPEWSYIWSRDSWPGVNERELQILGQPANGAITDRKLLDPEIASELEYELDRWDTEFARIPPLDPDAGPVSRVIEQLRSLGYLQ